LAIEISQIISYSHKINFTCNDSVQCYTERERPLIE
jgi:hypothetical protein